MNSSSLLNFNLIFVKTNRLSAKEMPHANANMEIKFGCNLCLWDCTIPVQNSIHRAALCLRSYPEASCIVAATSFLDQKLNSLSYVHKWLPYETWGYHPLILCRSVLLVWHMKNKSLCLDTEAPLVTYKQVWPYHRTLSKPLCIQVLCSY